MSSDEAEAPEPFSNNNMAVASVSPMITRRSLVISRYGHSPYGRESWVNAIEHRMHSMYSSGIDLALGSEIGTIAYSSDKEKRDLQDLNERLANYVETVRFLEAQNKNLAQELKSLKTKWGNETSQVKIRYKVELDEARNQMNDAIRDKAKLEVQVASFEDTVNDLNKRLKYVIGTAEDWKKKWEQSIKFEAEIIAVKKRLSGVEADRDSYKTMTLELQKTISGIRIDLDNQTFLHIEADNRAQSLEEELEFLKTIHEQEMKEMSSLVSKDSTSENWAFWKNEMGEALREIQQLYNDKFENMRAEMEASYSIKVEDFKIGATRTIIKSSKIMEENKNLKDNLSELVIRVHDLEIKNNQLLRDLEASKQKLLDRERELEKENETLRTGSAKLRAEQEVIMTELRNIVKTKIGLELEIAAYRKLLEGEEHRIAMPALHPRPAYGLGYRNPSFEFLLNGSSDDGFGTGGAGSKTPIQKSAKGPCSITETCPDGTFIAIENKGSKEENLTSWAVERIVDGKAMAEFYFLDDFNLQPYSRIKIWGQGHRPFDSKEPEADFNLWPSGNSVTTRLINAMGEERATYVQRSV